MLPQKILLNNGIRIIAEEMPSAMSCTLNIWLNVGSIDEEISNNGVSHFIEHIVFKGTKTRTALDIAEQSENVGANLNAFTDREHTCYHTRILSEHALIALELFLDMIFNSSIKDEDFDIEKQVILEEIKMYEDTPEDLVQDLLYEVIWKGHPLGKPITGNLETITALKKGTVTRFMSDMYTPDNIIISFAGKFDLDSIVKKVEELTSNIKTRCKKKEIPPLTLTPDIFVVDKSIEQTHLSFATKGVSVYDEDRYTLAVVDIALGGGMSSRLYQEIREKRGLAYSISSYYHTNRLGGLFGVYAAIPPKEVNYVIDLILKELNTLREHGLKPDELERAKMQLKTSLFLELESSMVRASRNALYDFYYNKFITPEEINHSVDSIINERIIRLANEIVTPKYYTLSIVGPRKEMPKKIKMNNSSNTEA